MAIEMKRSELPLTLLDSWAKINDISLHGVRIDNVRDRGFGVVADQTIETSPNSTLIVVPKDLVLSAENVYGYAKTDVYLRELLEAVKTLAATSRGAVLLYLLHQTARTSIPSMQHIGVSGPWTQYIQFLRSTKLPTTWSYEEKLFLSGTSLEVALDAKMKSLENEFDYIKKETAHLEWCRDYWWSEDSQGLSFSIWLDLDSWYRSRGFQLPGHGDAALVPILDMINHEEGTGTNARYAENDNGDVHLLLKPGKSISVNNELLISYGDEKSAAEMLFSYGFIEDCVEYTSEITLEIIAPDDDPLETAKKFVSEASTARLYRNDKSISWESSFLWIVCVNQEDGLDFKVLQKTDGGRELKAFWKGDELEDVRVLPGKIQSDPLYEVYHLRAICLLQERIRDQIEQLKVSNTRAEKLEEQWNNIQFQQASRLRTLELKLLLDGDRELEEQKMHALSLEIVRKYLGHDIEPSEDPD